MLTAETNERLTQTGPGAPAGKFLRMYWWPIAAYDDLEKEPVQPVRLLSEDMTLFKDLKGNVGLIGERCAHRAISLAYGIPQENGLRCAYHGWTYNTDGRVVDMPFEPACLPLKVKSYPVEVLGGLVFAYMGPEPRPLLPRWEHFARDDMNTRISFNPLPCNWVQCMDNSMDPVHFEHLHAHYGNYLMSRLGQPATWNPAVHVKIDFDVFKYGIYKRRLLKGEPEDCDDWTIGHPVLFPHTLANAGGPFGFQIRVPVDDTHTVHISYGRSQPKDGEPVKTTINHVVQDYNDPFGRVNRIANATVPQDIMAWIAQGPVSDRTKEHLATSDKGVILFHNMIFDSIEKVERGEDPIGVIRDPAENTPYIEIKSEREARVSFETEERRRQRDAGLARG